MIVAEDHSVFICTDMLSSLAAMREALRHWPAEECHTASAFIEQIGAIEAEIQRVLRQVVDLSSH